MRLTRYFLPILRETPAEAQIASHRLMLRAGMIRQASAGIYSWLPLGYKVLRRIETIVHEEQQRAGHIPLLMPTLQSAELWRESGRYDDYGAEMLRIKDRHQRDMLYGPTNEELITDIFRSAVTSYKELPLTLYHIQWKFRDEVRPRFGVMRGREFLMKDGYNFDLTDDGRAARLQPAHGQLHPHLRADGAEGDPDARRRRGDRRRPYPRVPGAGADRRERGLLRPGGDRPDARRPRDRLCRPRAGERDRRGLDRALRPHRRAARPGGLRRGAGGAAGRGARHRGRADLLLRHQVFRADEGAGRQRGRRAGAGAHGLATASASRGWSGRSSRRATTTRASSGPRG